MGKSIGAVGVTLTMGVAALSVLTGLLGAHAEAVTLGVMGLGLFGMGRVFTGAKVRQTEPARPDAVAKAS